MMDIESITDTRMLNHVRDCFQQGYDACIRHEGQIINSANPYGYGTMTYRAWVRGWNRAMLEHGFENAGEHVIPAKPKGGGRTRLA